MTARKEEINQDTPMWWALQKNNELQVSIDRNNTKMFWLGYFLRKNMLEENLIKLTFINNK